MRKTHEPSGSRKLFFRRPAGALFAARLKAQILTEEGQDVILETVGDFAGVGTGIDLEGVGDSILVERVVQFSGIDS